MADGSDSAFELCSLITQNDVHAIHATLSHGDRRFMVWTRLSEQNSSWILNISDGMDVWKLELDKEQLQSHKELAEIEKYETYFAKFRSEFESGTLSVAQLVSKMTLTVGSGLLPLIYDLYEAKASEKKVEMQAVIFRLADNVTELTQKLKVATESLDRFKAQKESSASAGPSLFDALPKKSRSSPVKRKHGYSLINPGSRNENSAPPSLQLDPEGSLHSSILTGNQALDIYKCTDANCQHMCTLSNKRYHCPLCDNKPQKPGRMRRHFMKMHSGKQLVQHGSLRMLRCKLKCMRANGRIAENSHYHCYLCGRVLMRKVHLYCHLQAHSFGTADDVDEDAMDDGKDDEEPEDEADVDDDDAGNNSSLDTSHMSGIASSQPENVVALTDGTQVVYVQSIQGGETLAVVPIDGHPDNLQLSEAQHNQLSPAVTSSADLSAQLQVLASSADGGHMADLGVVPQELPQGLGDGEDSSALAKQVEAILNQGEQNVADLQLTDTGDQNQLRDLSSDVNALEQFTGQQSNMDSKLNTQSDIEMTQDTDIDTHKHNEVDNEPMEFDSSLADLDMTTASAIAQEPNQMLDVAAMAVATEGLSSHPASLDLSSQLVNSTPMTSTPGSGAVSLQSSVLSISTSASTPIKTDYKFTMLTPDSQGQGASQTPHTSRKPKASIQDSLVLLDTKPTPKGDDEVFKFIVSSGAAQTCCCFDHPSVLVENQCLNIGRCKNTDCDCRLYHCPLCTCLPNKPGRIREHFKKIHAEELIIRYKGLQMLRCKLGCSRPNGKKVFNSHYHCCVCGHICIRKSGLYEHMRVQHADVASKNTTKSESACCGGNSPNIPKSKELYESQVEPCKTSLPSTAPVVFQLPAQSQLGSVHPIESGNQPVQPATPTYASQGQIGATGNQQAVTVQIPPLGDGQGSTGQQLVIVLPQQTPLGQVVNSGQSQQPIVIVMPQIGAGQLAQPIVIPCPQNTRS